MQYILRRSQVILKSFLVTPIYNIILYIRVLYIRDTLIYKYGFFSIFVFLFVLIYFNLSLHTAVM